MGFDPLQESINIHFGKVFADYAVDEDVAVADFLQDEAIAQPRSSLVSSSSKEHSANNGSMPSGKSPCATILLNTW